MGLNHYPNIVTTNLDFYLDAANPRSYSYSTSSNVWINLVGQKLQNSIANYSIPIFDGSSLSFNGTNQVVECGNNAIFTPNPTKGLTLEAWINASTFGAGSLSRIVDKQQTGNGYTFFLDNSSIANGFRYATQTVTGSVDSDSVANVITLNVWHNLAVTQNANTVIFYVNGQKVKTSALSFPFPGTTSRFFRVANRGSIDRAFDGKIACVRLYSRDLTEDEIRQNFNAFRGRFGI